MSIHSQANRIEKLHSAESMKGIAVNALMQPFRPLLDDPTITEVAMNEPGVVWAKTFEGWERHEIPVLDRGTMESLTSAIAAYNSTGSSTQMFVVLPDGSRGTITRPPGVIDGQFSFLVRKHASVVMTLEQLVEQGSFEDWQNVGFNQLTPDQCREKEHEVGFDRLKPFETELLTALHEGRIADFLTGAVKHRCNMVIAGKTGSGKTTFARSLIEKVDTKERLVTIEDVPEMSLENHPNRVHMLYGEGQGRITIDQALTSCMRMSPDRIFLAELKGDEAWGYLTSLNNGHPGSITTTHANNALQTFERIATLVKKSPVGKTLDLEMIKMVLHTTVNVILFFHERKLVEVFYDPLFARSKMK